MKKHDAKTNLFIVQGAASHLESLIDEQKNPPDGYDVCWTCPRQVKPGDVMLIYLLAPVSAIVGFAYFDSEPFIQTEAEFDWFGKPMAIYHGLRLFAPENYITLKQMRLLFPDWHWVSRPQGSTIVPDKSELRIREPFLTLLSERASRAAADK